MEQRVEATIDSSAVVVVVVKLGGAVEEVATSRLK
jgi:hypothetical protein